MSKIIEYMQELDLTSQEKIERYFFDTDLETLLTFDEYMCDLAFQDWSISEYSPYSFSPSMDVSGFGGCSQIDCKLERAHKFNKYACLYSDTVYLIVDSITNPHSPEITDKNERQYRYELFCDYSLLFLYSGLISKGIAKVIPPNFSICPNCFSELIINEKELSQLEPIIVEYSRKAILEATMYNRSKQLGLLSIKNLPELFPDHDGFVSMQNGFGYDILKNVRKFPHVISDNVFSYQFMKEYIIGHYLTAKFETFISSAYQSKFITAKASDKALIDITSKATIGTTPAPIFEMPFLDNLDTNTILSLRETEYHAFNEYRIALDNATKIFVTNPEGVDAKEIYDDVVYPAFVKLDAMFDRTKRMHAFKNMCELAIISSSVTLGVMNSTIPNDPVGIITALGGSSALVKQLGNTIERKLTSGNELEKQDFYFLWKLKKMQ